MTKQLQFKPLAVRAAKAAELIGVSERTFADWMTGENPPPHFRRGGCVLFPIHDLRLWLTAQLDTSSESESKNT